MDEIKQVTTYTEEEKAEMLNRLALAVNTVYLRPKKLFARAFFMGIFSGLGATIGVAVVLALIGLIIKEFGGLPVVGQWITELGRVIPAKK